MLLYTRICEDHIISCTVLLVHLEEGKKIMRVLIGHTESLLAGGSEFLVVRALTRQ